MPGKIHIGIGGWTYEPWRGTFYPPGLPQVRELEYAAGAVTAIEINGTYYRSQSPASFEKWAKAAPPGFAHNFSGGSDATASISSRTWSSEWATGCSSSM